MESHGYQAMNLFCGADFSVGNGKMIGDGVGKTQYI